MLERRWTGILSVIFLAGSGWAIAAEDIVIADFEGKDYGAWVADGTAFGTGPARGTLPGQMKVTGFKGDGLVNSFHGGDEATGTLTSPSFTIERSHINFLIGGGGWPEETGVHLIVGGEVVRMVSGSNKRSGGSEMLHWQSMAVAEFMAEEALIRIVDRRSKGWGHINVDQIMQGDTPFVTEQTRDFQVSRGLLNLPVKNGVPKTFVRLKRGEDILREFDIELAPGEPDFWVPLDLGDFQGESLTLWAQQVSRDSEGFEAILQADRLIGGENMYGERYRPQFHFSPQRGWNNDPNGMVYYRGEYHLFFQHNPYGWSWGNMTWGHAVSRDLVHWEELGDAIHPDELGTIFSGSAVVDWNNTTGFQTGDEPPLVAIFTYAGDNNLSSRGVKFTQALAYSNDRGRSWTKYAGNPVLGHIRGANRDPKVIWHEATGQWVIVLYLEDKRLGFFTSADLKTWEKQSEAGPFYECPELFELALDGDEKNKKWILYGAAGDYYVGGFDGKKFTPETEVVRFHYGNCFYASQTFSDIPEEDGRRIQIAWGRIGHPSMPFNQMMDFPVVLTLHRTEDGPRMFVEPVEEIEKLYAKSERPGEMLLDGEARELARGEFFDISATFSGDGASEVGFNVRGLSVVYDAKRGELRCQDKAAPLTAMDGKVTLRILVDRLSVEIFAGGGRVYMPMGHVVEEVDTAVDVFAKGGRATVSDVVVNHLNSAW
jgi:fructan beta-fructosidase